MSNGKCMFLAGVAMAALCAQHCGDAGAAEGAREGGGAMQKMRSAFYPDEILARARTTIAAQDWAAEAGASPDAMQREIVSRAAPWLDAPDDQLWGFMFGPAIKRSWMVWSNGFCPACKKDVKMYTWEMDPWAHPWKVRCPQCKELFPKNDFEAFHRSGLDEHGVFDPARANRSLLFNADHPDPNDPLHTFGVDDGDGYVDAEGHRWRFIGAYLIYGQWKRLIVDGIVNLGAAYAVTGDARYAYKAALMFDRVADVFPGFDFGVQGIVYERKGDRGQVSTWHDACYEIHQMALAYDRIFAALPAQEPALVAYLSKKAEQYKLDNPKRSWADVQRNIEERIFRDTLANPTRIDSNYPTTDVALLLIKTVLDWPRNRDEVLALLDGIINVATAVDGVSGEKGLDGYGAIAPHTVAGILAQFSLLEPDFLKMMLERHPVLHQTYRFHVDTWCMDEWYPRSGDCGAFGAKDPNYAGVSFTKNPGVNPSMWTFLWNLHLLTGDPAFAQVLYRANGNTLEGMPYDLFAQDPAAMQKGVQAVIDKAGATIQLGSVNKQQWRLAILRSGKAENRRALWLDYDTDGRHGHMDGLNIGLFAKGLDLIPDFGYPPVGYGGWEAPKARWYTVTPAHVTVVVDGRNQSSGAGSTTLWADGERFRAIRASAPECYGIERYERLAALVDLDEKDSYIIDVFFLAGGKDHAKFFHSFIGTVETDGLTLQPAPDYGYSTEMRNFRRDPAPAPGWSADWRIRDAFNYLPQAGPPADVHLRYTDLTAKAEASLCEAWIDTGQYGGSPDWIPRVMVRRTSQAGPPDAEPLVSAFAAVIEPYEGQRKLGAITRLPLETMNGQALPDPFVAIEIGRADGRKDVFLAVDGRGMAEMVEPKNGISFRGQMAHVTLGPNGLERVALGKSERLRVGQTAVVVAPNTDYVEVAFGPEGPRQVAGPASAIDHVKVGDQTVPLTK